jgi:hypothetical protein
VIEIREIRRFAAGHSRLVFNEGATRALLCGL